MSKSKVASGRAGEKPTNDPKYHPVMIPIDKAKALASVLEQLGEADGSNNLVNAMNDGTHPDAAAAWLHSVVATALREALDEVEQEFRKSLTPDTNQSAGIS
jgi:hypothetical protein